MTDRDRLAADLTELIVDIEEERLPIECVADECSHADGEHPEPGVNCGDGKRLADRLIALGWKQECGGNCGIIDGERLARALIPLAGLAGHRMSEVWRDGAASEIAAAIAKAYREDTREP